MANTLEPKLFERIAHGAAQWTGSSWAFLAALGLVLSWLAIGILFAFSTGWLLAMDTFCGVSTFMMVFLLQRSQNKDSLAMQIKLNEIIAVLQGANNHLINIEELSEEEILLLRKRYQDLAVKIQKSAISTHPVFIDDPGPEDER